MQVENGDDAGLPEYKIPAGSHVRVLVLAEEVEPATFTTAPALFPIISVIVKQPNVSPTLNVSGSG